MPSELQDYTYILEEPNTFQWLTEWLDDSGRIAEYITGSCTTETIEQPRAWEYIYWLDYELVSELDSNSTMVQCVDNFGAYEEFARCGAALHI